MRREFLRTVILCRSGWWIPAEPAEMIPERLIFRRLRRLWLRQRARGWRSTETARPARSVEARTCWRRSEYESICHSKGLDEESARLGLLFFLRRWPTPRLGTRCR